MRRKGEAPHHFPFSCRRGSGVSRPGIRTQIPGFRYHALRHPRVPVKKRLPVDPHHGRRHEEQQVSIPRLGVGEDGVMELEVREDRRLRPCLLRPPFHQRPVPYKPYAFFLNDSPRFGLDTKLQFNDPGAPGSRDVPCFGIVLQ